MSEAAVRIGRQDIPRTFRRGWRSSFSTTPVYSCARSSPEEAEGKGRRGHRNSEGMTRLTSDPYRSVVGAAVDRKPRMNGSRVYVEEIVRDQLQRTSSDSSETYTTEFFFHFVHLRRTGSILHQREPIFGCVISMDIILPSESTSYLCSLMFFS